MLTSTVERWRAIAYLASDLQIDSLSGLGNVSENSHAPRHLNFIVVPVVLSSGQEEGARSAMHVEHFRDQSLTTSAGALYEEERSPVAVQEDG